MYRSGQRVVTQAIQKYLGSSYDVVKTVYDNLTDVSAVADNLDDVTSVADNLTLLLGLQNLADNADKVVDVADNLDDVTSVADNLTDVSAVADNIVAVTEVNAKVDDFNTKYLGSYASAPTEDGNGDPLVEGATYWNTTLNAMFVYTGSQWVKPTGTGIVDVDTFTGDGSTASFPLDVSPASKTNTSVFIDGVYQEKDTYSVSTNLITFNTAPNDEASIEVIVNELTNFITGTQTETHTLTSGQTVVNLTNSPAFASFHIQGEDVDSQRLDLGTDYTLDLLTNTITLTNSYPENTVLKMLYGYDDDISVELAPLNQAILDHVNDTTDAHDISAIGGVADRLALSGNAVFTDTTQFATGTTKDGVLSDDTLEVLRNSDTQLYTERFYASSNRGAAKYHIRNTAEKNASSAYNGREGLTCFNIRGGDYWACLTLGYVCDVMQLGAAADSITNDSPSIQAAVDLFRLIFFPSAGYTNRYRVEQTINVPSDRRLEGMGSRDGVVFNVIDCTLFKLDSSEDVIIQNMRAYSTKTTDTWMVDAYNSPRGLDLQNLYADGFGNVDGGGGFKLVYECWGSKLTRLACERSGYGIYMSACSACVIDTPAIRKLARNGVYMSEGVGNLILGGVIEKTWGEEGAVVGTGYSVYINGTDNVNISGLYTEQSIDGLIKVKGSYGVTIENCFIDGFTGSLIDGLVSFEDCSNCKIEGCFSEGLYSGIGANPKCLIYVDSGCADCQISNNFLEPDGSTGGYDTIIDDGIRTVVTGNKGYIVGEVNGKWDFSKVPQFRAPNVDFNQSGMEITNPDTSGSDVIALNEAPAVSGTQYSGIRWKGSNSGRTSAVRVQSNNFTRSNRWIWSFNNDGEGETDSLIIHKNFIGSASDNTISCGSGSYRFTEVFSANGTINTSDEREKTELLDISEQEKACALEIKQNIKKFKFLTSVEKKGEENARIHFGVGAQTVKSIFESRGLNPDDYSLFCYDEWDTEYEQVLVSPEVLDDDGNVVEEAVYQDGDTVLIEGGSRYGIRYEQLSMFILAAL